MNIQTKGSVPAESLWMGLADVIPLVTCEFLDPKGGAGAITYVVAYADDSKRFIETATEALEVMHLKVRSIEDVQLVTEKEADSGLSDDLRALVLHVKETMYAGVGTFFPYDK